MADACLVSVLAESGGVDMLVWRRSWQIPANKRWVGMIILGVIFTVSGLGILVGSFIVENRFDGWMMFGVGILVAITGIIPIAYAPRARRETSKKVPVDLVPTQQRVVGDEPSKPWPVSVVAGALAQELEGTPYAVAHNDQVIRVTWDLDDRSWWVLAQRNGTSRAFEIRLVLAAPGKTSRTDHWYALDWQAGVPVIGAMTSETSGGRVWRYEKRIEMGTDGQGLSKEVDYTFNTADLDRPLHKTLARAGWDKPKWGAEAKGALIVGGIGASAIVFVPLALLLDHWWGG